MFRNIKGQAQVIDLLSAQIANDRIAHAYLFHGADGVGKFTTALYFGMGLNCLATSEYRPCGVCSSCKKFLSFEHSDFIYIFPSSNLKLSVDGEIKNSDGLKDYEAFMANKRETPWKDYAWSSSTEIRKESIAMLLKRLEMSVVEARYRIVIIDEAETMNKTTANAFLKKLEEPPANTVIILITERISMLLPTIISRCQQVYFRPLTQKAIESVLRERFDVDHQTARSAAKLSGANMKNAIRIALDNTNETRDLAFEIVRMAFDKDDLAFHDFVTKKQDKAFAETLEGLIRYIHLIVNDICVYGIEPEMVTNSDRIETIAMMAEPLPLAGERADALMVALEELIRKLVGNVNPTLIMINMYYKLKDFLAH